MGDKLCIMCFKPNHKKSVKRINCEICNRYCFNQECWENHSKVCEKFCKCWNSNKVLKRSNKMVDGDNNMIEEGSRNL